MAKPLRVGVIGIGSWSEICHIPGVQAHPEAEVVALCSRSAPSRRAQAQKFGVESTYADYHELVARSDIDAITITTPNAQHHPIAKAALEAGKHVFCEKPLTLHHRESAELLALAEARGLTHHVAFTFRFLHAAHEAQRLIASGAIGELQHVQALTEGGGALRPDALAYWRDDAELSGYGMLGDMGSHLVDLTRFVSRGEFSAVRGAQWRISRDVRPDGVATGYMRPVTADEETEALCELRPREGAAVSVSLRVSKLSTPPTRNHIDFFGSTGVLRLPYSRGNVDTLYLARDGGALEEMPLPTGAEPAHNHCLDKMLGAFVDGCLGRRTPRPADQPATFADGHAAQQVLDAIAHAARTGAPAQVG